MSLLDDIIEDRDCEGFDAYMRRSCRVVELEQGYIDLRRAADELAETLDVITDKAWCASVSMDEVCAVQDVLTAYRTAIGEA